MNIETISQDLVTRLQTIPEFNVVGLAVGGRDIDPFNRDIPKPSCWAVFIGDDLVSEPTMNPKCPMVRMNFLVKIMVDYGTEAELTSTTFPLLYSVIQTIQGGEPIPGSKWMYEGQGLEELNSDRLVWVQQFSIVTGL